MYCWKFYFFSLSSAFGPDLFAINIYFYEYNMCVCGVKPERKYFMFRCDIGFALSHSNAVIKMFIQIFDEYC